MTFRSSSKRQEPIGECSSRWATTKIAVDSEQVISAARRALDLPEKPQVSWDDIRDAIINGLVVGGNSSPPPEVTGLFAPTPLAKICAFFGHDSPTNGPSEVPVQDLCS